MKTRDFIKYITEDRILAILIKERVKWIGKDEYSRNNSNVYSKLREILPSRRTWVQPSKKERSRLANEKTRNLKNAATALKFTIARDRDREKSGCGPDYLKKLNGFFEEIKDDVRDGKVSLCPPKTTGLFKDKEEVEGLVIATFRPISVYNDLKTKVFIKLASEYLTDLLDPLFHEEILSYRRRRNYHREYPKTLHMTNAGDAIPNIQKFRQEHNSSVWVAECDIKKFYDIVNHDQVMAALDRLIEKGGVDRERASGAIAILKEYLDSYNFKECVLDESSKPGFWKGYMNGLRRNLKEGKRELKCQFKWVPEKEFFEKGGYSPDTWETDLKKIGIPQGGVLSTLICNILMNDVDGAVVDPSDKDRLFNRFGDDIILMHATEEGCRSLFDAYKKSLADHQLIYHDENPVSDFKDGIFIKPDYWDVKTKAPFLWGRGDGNAAEWIGFVGYEISCDGNVRLRKSTLKKQFNKICHRYHKVTSIKKIETTANNCLSAFDKVSWTIRKFDQLDLNPASLRQMHYLDRYRHKKRKKAEQYLSNLPLKERKEKGKKPIIVRKIKNPSSYASLLSPASWSCN